MVRGFRIYYDGDCIYRVDIVREDLPENYRAVKSDLPIWDCDASQTSDALE
jgi:hypothetical protein